MLVLANELKSTDGELLGEDVDVSRNDLVFEEDLLKIVDISHQNDHFIVGVERTRLKRNRNHDLPGLLLDDFYDFV